MREWEARVASEAQEIKLTDSALRNHLPEFLDELADWMQQGEAPGTSRMRAAAARHASQRLDHSFQLTQLVHEYRCCGQPSCTSWWGPKLRIRNCSRLTALAERVVELARLNAGLGLIRFRGHRTKGGYGVRHGARQADARRPRWTGEIRPTVDGSKPANGRDPRPVRFYPAASSFCNA
jgi:hypothetical protein